MSVRECVDIKEEHAELLPARDTMLTFNVSPTINVAPVIGVNMAFAINAATIGSTAAANALQGFDVSVG